MLSGSDEGKKLLESVLKRGLDDGTVRKLLDATSFHECLSSGRDTVDGVLERLILQGAKQPFLALACGALAQYYNLCSRYAFSVALIRMIDDYFEKRLVLELAKNVNMLVRMGWINIYKVRYQTH